MSRSLLAGSCHFRARWFVDLAQFGAGSLVDEVGDRALPIIGGVQVDERGPGGRVAHAVHQFTEVRARVGREGISGVAQVVKMRAGRTLLLYGLDPEAVVEVAVLHRLVGRGW